MSEATEPRRHRFDGGSGHDQGAWAMSAINSDGTDSCFDDFTLVYLQRRIAELKRQLAEAQTREDMREAETSAAIERCNHLIDEVARLRSALLEEADYCYSYAAKYATSDPARAERHRERGDRLKRAALAREEK